MSGAMDNSYANMLALWAAVNAALAARGLPEADHDEARRLWHLAHDEEARVTFQHLKRAFCTGACPQDGQQ